MGIWRKCHLSESRLYTRFTRPGRPRSATGTARIRRAMTLLESVYDHEISAKVFFCLFPPRLKIMESCPNTGEPAAWQKPRSSLPLREHARAHFGYRIAQRAYVERIM